MDVATVEGVEEALDQCGPLQGKGGQEEGEAHAAEAVALQEDHEEAEAHEDHGVHVLEAYNGQGHMKHWGVLWPRPINQSAIPSLPLALASQGCLEVESCL